LYRYGEGAAAPIRHPVSDDDDDDEALAGAAPKGFEFYTGDVYCRSSKRPEPPHTIDYDFKCFTKERVAYQFKDCDSKGKGKRRPRTDVYTHTHTTKCGLFISAQSTTRLVPGLFLNLRTLRTPKNTLNRPGTSSLTACS
jgi:hypothetical protein